MYVYNVCPKDRCNVVYRGVYADHAFCPLCKTPRYIGEDKATRRPAKLMYYISIVGYVKQICHNEEFVK